MDALARGSGRLRDPLAARLADFLLSDHTLRRLPRAGNDHLYWRRDTAEIAA